MKYVIRITALLVVFFLAYSTSHAEVFTGKHGSLGITIDAVDTSAIVNVSYSTIGISTFTPYTVEICKKVGTQTTCADKRNESIVFGTNTHTFKNLTPSTSYTLVVSTNTGVNRSSIAFKTEVSFGALVFDAAGGNKARVTIPAGDKSQSYFIFHYNSLSAAKNTTSPLKIESVPLSAGQTATITSSAQIEATHYARLVGKDAQGKHNFLSPIAERGIFYSRDLKIDTSDTEAELLGFINKAKHEDYTGFKVRVYVTKNTTVASDDPYYVPERIESDGSYKVVLRNLTPNTPYYFKHVVTSPLGTSEAIEDKFPSSGAYTPEGSASREVDFNDRSYSLLAPFPGLTTVLDPDLCREKKAEGNLGGGQICGINEFINLILKILVGVTAVMLVVRIIIEGYNYVVTDVPFLKASAKTHLFESVFGLILALSSFLILNTINPKLVAGEVSIRQESSGIISQGQEYRLEQTQSIAANFKKTSYYEKIKTIAAAKNFPHCLLQVTIQRESNGVVGIGHDEDAASHGVPSRRNFIASGKKFSGETFDGSNKGLITTRNFLNTDHLQGRINSAPNTSTQDLGLDWRFSHSIGLFGVTFFPKGSSYADYSKGLFVKSLNKTVFPKDIYSNPDTDIAIAAEKISEVYNACNKNIDGAFRKYNSGSCIGNNAFTNKEAPIRKKLYDQCVAQG